MGNGTHKSQTSLYAKILNTAKPLYMKFVNQETATVTGDFNFTWYEI